MNKKKLVSIILPTFNGSKYINKAIDSILLQSFLDWELLIIDDGSTDGTENIIKKYTDIHSTIRYFKNNVNLGIQKSLNRGLRESEGKYVARIDDDDEWADKDKLKKQVDFLDKNIDYVLVGTGVIVVDKNEVELFKYKLPKKDNDIRSKILLKNCFVHSSVVFKRDLALKLKGYSEDIDTLHIEDYDLWLKLGTMGKMANLDIYGVFFMSRENSISSVNKMNQFKKDLNLIKKYRNKYPNYFRSIIFNYIKLYFYKTFNLIPSFLKYKLIYIYKNF